jgi:MoxR-vWA-beta-propeller ternary system domain bpX5
VTQRAPSAQPAALPIALIPRPSPLPAIAAVATGDAARALARRLLAEPDETLAALRGLAGEDLLAVLGEPDALPWIDGVIYLGCDPDAPRLLLPTALRPDVAAQLYEAAVLARLHSTAGAGAGAARIDVTPPIAVLPSPRWIFSVAAAAPIQRARLAAWLERAP